jgi:hypothetical protein
MRRIAIVVVGYVLAGSSVVRAQDPADYPDDDAELPPSPPELALPTSAAPTETPPAPPLVPALSPIRAEAKYLAGEPLDDAQATDATGSGDGQWVFTGQYGWVFMPYGDQYVDRGITAQVESPFAFVYVPSDGWGWVAAPWLWGWGTYPYFGASDPSRLAWYRWLYDGGYGWGGYRGGRRQNVRRIGSTWYIGSAHSQEIPAAAPVLSGGRQPGYHHHGFLGGRWGGQALGGYVRGNGFGGAGPSRVPPTPQGSGTDGGHRGGERSPGGVGSIMGPVRSGASAGGGPGIPSSVAPRHGGGAWGSGLRGGSGRDDRRR